MPNLKIGAVVPANANLEPLIKRLRATIRLVTKKGLNLQCLIGKENQSEEEIAENILIIYQALTKQVPDEHHNIKNLMLKTTMGKTVKI